MSDLDEVLDRTVEAQARPGSTPMTELERYNAARRMRSGHELPPLTQAQFDRRRELAMELDAGVSSERELEIRIERAEQDGLRPGLNPQWVHQVATATRSTWSLGKSETPPRAPTPLPPPTTDVDPVEFERRRQASLKAIEGAA